MDNSPLHASRGKTNTSSGSSRNFTQFFSFNGNISNIIIIILFFLANSLFHNNRDQRMCNEYKANENTK